MGFTYYILAKEQMFHLRGGVKLCIRAQYPSKAEAVGITSYMVQLKEGITLTAKEQRYILESQGKFTKAYDISEKRKEKEAVIQSGRKQA